MLSVAERRVMEAVIEKEAGDFLRAMDCFGPSRPGGALGPCVHAYKTLFRSNGSIYYYLDTECRYNGPPVHFSVSFEYTRGYKLMLDKRAEQEELARLTLDATRKLCSQIIADFDSIDESTLRLLPLYHDACEELRHSPEKVAEWLLEKGLHYHAAKNFLQGEENDHCTDDSGTCFYGYHA